MPRHKNLFTTTQTMRAIYAGCVAARTELKEIGRKPTTGSEKENLHVVVNKRTKANSGWLQTGGQDNTHNEARHILIDYRNGNEHIATKIMTRKKAFEMNARLKDTGYAWAVKGGY